MKYRKKPVVIDAVQYDIFSRTKYKGVCELPHDGTYGGPHIHTLEGELLVRHQDWIITGVKGEKYPCKPDIFVLTYEPVDPNADVVLC